MKSNFTAGRVDKFSCKTGKHQSIFWDAKTPGLGLRVTKNGAKSFVFESRLHGKTLRLTIGDQRTWDIGTAQEEATRLKRLVDQGIDPRASKGSRMSRLTTFNWWGSSTNSGLKVRSLGRARMDRRASPSPTAWRDAANGELQRRTKSAERKNPLAGPMLRSALILVVEHNEKSMLLKGLFTFSKK